MTVKELIKRLRKVKDQSLPVAVQITGEDCDRYRPAVDIYQDIVVPNPTFGSTEIYEGKEVVADDCPWTMRRITRSDLVDRDVGDLPKDCVIVVRIV